MPPLALPASARRVLRPLAAKAAALNLPVYAVGGCVRDWLLGRPVFDLDLVAEGDPAPLARLCAGLLGAQAQAFGQFGTLRVVGKTLRVDFAMSRREVYPEPASLPVVKPASIVEDLGRRDFTVNAIAARLEPKREGELLDPHRGQEDLRARRLRVLHPLSFRDDPTRVFRAARYSCRLGLNPAPGLVGLAKEALKQGHAGRLSRHRLAQELLRVLAEEDPACALERLRGWGYLSLIHPDLRWPARALPGVEERLAALALALPDPEGERFVASLPLERPLAARLREALALARGSRSPRSEPSALAARAVSLAFPRLPKAALRPLLVSGEDLKDLGVAPGEDYRRILDAAARAQWAGQIPTRARALAWLRRFLGR